jgi:hypothetical protein
MRGLFLAVLALLVVAGDTSRYIPQLVFNANAILASANQKNTSDVEADHMRAAFSLLWRAAKKAPKKLLNKALLLPSKQMPAQNNYS